MKEKEELKRSHECGFGGSDAAMFYKIGTRGADVLSNTDIRRVQVALGLAPFVEVTETLAMAAGHDFEEHMAHRTFDTGGFEREVLMERSDLAKSCRTFAHADFATKTGEFVLECKYSQDDTDKVLDTYYAQLQWYYLLGAKQVTLIHGWGGVFPFEVQGRNGVIVERDASVIEAMERGIRIVDELARAGHFGTRETVHAQDLTMSQLDGEQADAVAVLYDAVKAIKAMEERADAAKAELKEWMESNGVMSIKGDGISITHVASTTRKTFDTKKAQKAYPELEGDEWYKVSNVSSSIKITVK